MPSKTTLIGQSAIRKDAKDKVTGGATYTADITLPNMRYGAILRSPHHHARIKAIDVSAATQKTGVIAVLTAEDIPGNPLFGALIQDQPVLAIDVVRFMGEPVALVVADSKQAACDALADIRVEYEALEPVFDPQEALSPQAPIVHPS
jgi:CO/xanthine dehydrogenase Mo-binding subunit